MKSSITTPVLLIAFNRPDTTQIAFNRIREVKPPKLYIAIDGPRHNKPDEYDLCQQVIEITKKVDWDCEAKYLIRDKNLGCKLGVSEAISWALENEDRVIIIEDDIVLRHSFFGFVDELLDKYQFQDKIAMISASNFTPIKSDYDYLFSMNGHIGGGWATWKRVWDKFDVMVPELGEAINNNFADMNFVHKQEKTHYNKYFGKLSLNINKKTENYWGPQFVFYRRFNNLLSIVPRVNMSTNIGFFSARADTVSYKSKNNFWKPDFDLEVINRPNNISWNIEYDKYHFKNFISKKTPFIIRVFHIVIRILKQLKND